MRTASTTGTGPRPLVPLALAVLTASFGTSSANVALPSLAAAFGASFGSVQWVVLSYLVAMAASLVTAGRLGDLLGRRRLFLYGLCLSGGGALLCAASPALWVLVMGRAMQGLGAALLITMAFALVGDSVEAGRQGVAMGVLGSMSSLGTMLGPVLGGLALDGPGWRALFAAPLPVVLLAAWSGRALGPHPKPSGAMRDLDWVGAALLGAALTVYAIACTPGQAGDLGGPVGLGLLGLALLLAAGFLLRQRQAATPLLRLTLFRDRTLAFGVATTVLVSTVMMATLVTGPFYLSLALRLPPAQEGLVLAIGPVVAVLAGIPAGRLADRFGAGRVALCGLALLSLGAAWLSRVTIVSGVAGYALPMTLLSAGYAAFQSPNTAAVMAQAGADDRGAVSGLLNLGRNLGLLTGASLMGAIFTTGAGGTVLDAPPDAMAAGMRLCFAFGTGLAMTALVTATFTWLHHR